MTTWLTQIPSYEDWHSIEICQTETQTKIRQKPTTNTVAPPNISTENFKSSTEASTIKRRSYRRPVYQVILKIDNSRKTLITNSIH